MFPFSLFLSENSENGPGRAWLWVLGDHHRQAKARGGQKPGTRGVWDGLPADESYPQPQEDLPLWQNEKSILVFFFVKCPYAWLSDM